MERKWEQFTVFYNDHYAVDLGEKHRFPMDKYRLVREKLLAERVLSEAMLCPAALAHREEIYLAHDMEYVDQVLDLTLSPREARKVGLPLTKEMALRTRSSVGAVMQAAQSALEKGFSGSLCGGTHHAHKNRGEGFCYFNDFAVAIAKLRQNSPNLRVLILDLDAHQGNGNSSMLGEDPLTYIVSFHGSKNYPYKKVPSNIDVSLPPGTDDKTYIDLLTSSLGKLSPTSFDLILYQAGVDPLEHDKLGTLSLSFEGLMRRDQIVFELARGFNLPISVAMGGGYSYPIEHTVEAAANTYKAAKKVFS